MTSITIADGKIGYERLANLELLIVEDSVTQAMILKETLEKHQIRVNIAKDGIEGIEAINAKKPEIVISDIEMPRMNGFEFCHYIKADPKLTDIPVIILTNLSDSMDVIKGIECGADSFLTKPCTTDLLLNNITDVLENKKMRKEKGESIKLAFSFGGQKHQLEVNQGQVTDLLLSTYSNAIQKNVELEQAYRKLNTTHQDVERKNKELLALNTQKNQFLGMAAHDLRNPLMAIQGYSDLLLEKLAGSADNDTTKMLQHIQKSSLFMLHLINELLDFSAIESGKVQLNLSQVDVVDLVKECIALASGSAEKKFIHIQTNVKEKIPKIQCDADKIEQVINNLITNAIKYSHPNKTIEVIISISNDNLIIAVKDQGVGIPRNELDNLFKAFTKTSVKTTAGETSTGLGLAIAKKIIEEHHGRIWVESQFGKGSTFFVSLPIK